MAGVIMMQMPGDKVIRMIAVRDALVPARWAVHVSPLMAAAIVIRRTRGRICTVYRDRMLIHVTAMQVMQMAIVKVISMIFMNHCCMAAI
jgi:hypothetical protein